MPISTKRPRSAQRRVKSKHPKAYIYQECGNFRVGFQVEIETKCPRCKSTVMRHVNAATYLGEGKTARDAWRNAAINLGIWF
ncbi:MAG: hypothetical protein V4467_01995 [Patescibacteria group bacterium]